MADETKPVEVPKEETPATTTEAAAPAEAPATETTDATAAPAGMSIVPRLELMSVSRVPAERANHPSYTTATEAATETTETPAAETAAAPAEEAKKEAEPVEDGQLEHKGSNFPKYATSASPMCIHSVKCQHLLIRFA